MGATLSSAARESAGSSTADARTVCNDHLTTTPLASVVLLPSERELDELREVVDQSGTRFHAQHVRAAEAEMAQASIGCVDRFVASVSSILEKSFDASCTMRGVSISLKEQVAIFESSLGQLESEAALMLRSILSVVAEAEIRLLNASGSNASMNSSARGASQRNRAKLLIQLRLERNIQLVDEALRRYVATASAQLENAVALLMRPLHLALEEESKGSEVPRAALVEHCAAALVTLLDPPRAVEQGEFLGLLHGSDDRPTLADADSQTAPKDSEIRERISTRVQLHAARLLSNAQKRRASLTTAAMMQETQRREEFEFTTLVAETQPAVRRLLAAKERQLEMLISEVHRFSCTPLMATTLTNAAGTHIIELDFPGGRPFEFREVRTASAEIRSGRYCKVSPAMLMLLVQERHHANRVVEHSAEVIMLVREDGAGWVNLSDGTVYSTVIPI